MLYLSEPQLLEIRSLDPLRGKRPLNPMSIF